MTGDGAEDLMPFFVRQWERDRIERLEHPSYNLLFPLEADIRLLGILLLQGPRDTLETIEHNLAEALGHGGDAAGITDESIREAARAAYDWILRMVSD